MVVVASARKKGYSGVAVLSKVPFDVLPDPGLDDEGRVVAVDFGTFILVNVYVMNAGAGLARLKDREAWDERFAAFVAGIAKPVLLCGDFNVARAPLDVNSPETKARVAGYTVEERAGFERLLERRALIDTFRALHPAAVKYSYWSNFAKSRERNVGWRIDYALASPELSFSGADVLTHVAGSDHAPVVVRVEPADRRLDLLATFQALKVQSQVERATFKARAYDVIVRQLEAMGPVTSKEALLGALKGVGHSIAQHIDQVFDRSVPQDGARRYRAIQELCTITSIGPATADELYVAGVTGVADLRAKHASGAIELNDKQALGLAHWEDFLLKIPREEMDRHRALLEDALAHASPDARMTVTGSYRRGAGQSGDIDVLVTAPDEAAFGAFVARLRDLGYLLPDTFG